MIYYGVVITGTDTGVGKTELARALARAFREKGKKVGVFKPVETGCKIKNGQPFPEDGYRLLEASGANLSLEDVVPYRLRAPVAPLTSAELEKIRIEFEKIFQNFDIIAGEFEMVIVETAGGLMVPLNENFSSLDMMALMKLPAIVVAENRLGAINHTLLSLEALRTKCIEIIGVVLNQTKPDIDPLVKESNRKLIQSFGRVNILKEIDYLSPSVREREFLKVGFELYFKLDPELRKLGESTIFHYIQRRKL